MNSKEIIKVVKKRGLSAPELEKILSSVETGNEPQRKQAFRDYVGKNSRIGIISDTHIGHKEFDEPLFAYAGKTFRKEGVDKVYHCGDILEGMSGREGHIYELNQIGFAQQIKEAERIFTKHLKGLDVKGINGNHDLWYAKKNNGGVNVSSELAQRVENYTHLGDEEADVELKKGITMKIFHPNDGTAYATSYKLQKLIESLTGGEKPEVLAEGHYHKALYMFNRNVHALEAGTLCGQSKWMRGKKIPAHKGFWILDIEMGGGGIGKFKPAFYPGYK